MGSWAHPAGSGGRRDGPCTAHLAAYSSCPAARGRGVANRTREMQRATRACRKRSEHICGRIGEPKHEGTALARPAARAVYRHHALAHQAARVGAPPGAPCCNPVQLGQPSAILHRALAHQARSAAGTCHGPSGLAVMLGCGCAPYCRVCSGGAARRGLRKKIKSANMAQHSCAAGCKAVLSGCAGDQKRDHGARWREAAGTVRAFASRHRAS